MKKLLTSVLLILLFCFPSNAQRRILNIPDLPGYITLKSDLHMHTVFSDGDVWPTIRVNEAWRDGLDAISITDHLEYIPHKSYIPANHNAAWKITETYAKERNIILVHGAEITRSMPPGHFNALFIKDANALATDSVWNSYEAAIKQGAFLMYNHPGWEKQQPDSIPKLYDIHRKLMKNGWLHGVEVFNDASYYPLALDWCTQNNIAVIATSDVHALISERFDKEKYTSRPMTLVFAKERTHDALREALFAGRTLAWFDDKLAGREEYAKPFFYQCVSIGKPYSMNDKNVIVEITNKSDIPFYLINKESSSTIDLPANSVTMVSLNKNVKPVYEVANVMVGGKEKLQVEIKF